MGEIRDKNLLNRGGFAAGAGFRKQCWVSTLYEDKGEVVTVIIIISISFARSPICLPLRSKEDGD